VNNIVWKKNGGQDFKLLKNKFNRRQIQCEIINLKLKWRVL